MKLKFYTTILSLVFISAISNAEEITFDTDVTYKKNNQQNFESLKRGDKIQIDKGENAFIISKQNIPLLVFSANSRDAQITIPATTLNAGVIELVSTHVDKATDEIIEGLRKAESFIQKRDYSQASQAVGLLKQKYKNNSSILFMSASINYLQNNKQSAISDLEAGLVLNPLNENAKRLLAKLKGGT